MKKRVLVILVLVFVAALLLGLSWQANAQANRIEGLTSYEYDCAILQTFQPTFTGKDKNQIMHIRDYVHVNINESDSLYLAGINTTFADAEMNFKNGSITIRGTMHLEPYAFPGSAWEGNWVFIDNGGTTFGRSIAQGTGALEGMTLFQDLYDAPLADDAVEKCSTVSYNGFSGVPEETFTRTEAYIQVSGRD